MENKMCESQLVQLDCRVDTCKFYQGAGKCSHPSPEITLNTNKQFSCWSNLENIASPKFGEISHRDYMITLLGKCEYEWMGNCVNVKLK